MAVFLLKSRHNYRKLPALPTVTNGQTPNVTVIIPARNEERAIARAIGGFRGLRVLVVDDASEDRTTQAAGAAGAEVLRAPPLPAGQLGKPNACQAGAAAATSRWLLFVDADTWYAPEFAASIVAFAEAESLELVTAFLRQEVVTASERILLPYAFALYFCGVSAANVNSPKSREALANGQCLLIRRDAYLSIGGHAAVASSVIEDVALAALAKSRGVRMRVVRAEHLGSVRMYDNFTAIRRGFEKNSFRFLGVNPLTGAQVMLASILLTSYLPLLAWLLAERQWLPALILAAIPAILLRPWYGGLARACAAPAAIYVFQAIALSAMVRTVTGIKTRWKGRDV
jgi:cellulose synthase/poly-beta-1,6-N-acetylglucosamine synthase-like glycosyltransferase